MGEDKRAGTDRHEGTLLAGVGLLKLGKVLDEFDRLGIFLQHVIYAHAAWNDQDIVFFQILVSIFKVDVGFDGQT